MQILLHDECFGIESADFTKVPELPIPKDEGVDAAMRDLLIEERPGPSRRLENS